MVIHGGELACKSLQSTQNMTGSCCQLELTKLCLSGSLACPLAVVTVAS